MLPISYWRNRKIYTRLLGSRCRSCGAEFFPPVKVCKRCGSRDVEEVEMPKTGVLVSYTKLTEPSYEFEEYAPIYLGFIRLDNGVQLVAQLTDVVEEELKPGARVEATVRKWAEDGEEGVIFYGYKFRITQHQP